MLSDTERHEIEAECAQYPTKRAVCIEALKIVQHHRGWVSDDALDDVAALLELSRAELEGVATFYDAIFRKPVGRHVVLLCDSVTCWMLGYERLRRHCAERLGIAPGETSADGRFTLLPSVCLGDCDHAPVMMVDRDHFGDLDPARLDEIFERYRGDTPLALPSEAP